MLKIKLIKIEPTSSNFCKSVLVTSKYLVPCTGTLLFRRFLALCCLGFFLLEVVHHQITHAFALCHAV